MIEHLKYLWYVLKHKWLVFVECCRLGIPWRGITHDLSKFSPREWRAYVRQQKLGFHPDDWTDEFAAAINAHHKANSHHPEYWILSSRFTGPWRIVDATQFGGGLGLDRRGRTLLEVPAEVSVCRNVSDLLLDLCNLANSRVLPMPDHDRREMLADWIGAGKAQGMAVGVDEWYVQNSTRIILHPETREWVEEQLVQMAL